MVKVSTTSNTNYKKWIPYVIVVFVGVLLFFNFKDILFAATTTNYDKITEPEQLYDEIREDYVNGFCKSWERAGQLRNSEERRIQKQALLERAFNTPNRVSLYLRVNDLPSEWSKEINNFIKKEREACGFDYMDN